MITLFTSVRWPADEGSNKLRAGQQTTLRSGQRVHSADTMKRKSSAMSQQYATALKKHLKQGPRAGLESARGLGRQAVAIGLETLDMARMHARALATPTLGMFALHAAWFFVQFCGFFRFRPVGRVS